MMTPGSAPSTPASKEPAVEEIVPSSNSAVSSPRYQTLPRASCAYQSKVSSTSSPLCRTLSRTTRAVIPFADRLRLGGDGHDDVEGLAICVGLRVRPAGAGGHRPVGVVDVGGERCRIEVDRLASLGKPATGALGGDPAPLPTAQAADSSATHPAVQGFDRRFISRLLDPCPAPARVRPASSRSPPHGARTWVPRSTVAPRSPPMWTAMIEPQRSTPPAPMRTDRPSGDHARTKGG